MTRKPYTATHAFGQSVEEPDRPWEAVDAPKVARSGPGAATPAWQRLWIACRQAGG